VRSTTSSTVKVLISHRIDQHLELLALAAPRVDFRRADA
jgi:hypothetical protein